MTILYSTTTTTTTSPHTLIKPLKNILPSALSTAASNGDLEAVLSLLSALSPNNRHVLNEKDEEGTTPLIYAACFGHVQVAFALLEAGADPDLQDKFGWTALMWSVNNNHEDLVRTLLDHGATTTTKTTKGRTALDFANGSNSHLSDMLNNDGNGQDFATHSFPEVSDQRKPQALPKKDVLEFYSAGGFDLDAMQAEDDFLFRMAMENVNGLETEMDKVDLDCTDEDEEEEDFQTPFDWDKCLPDQMFVYDPIDMDHMLDTIITNMKPMRSNKSQKPVPANVLFLSARYAQYFCNENMLDELLSTALEKLRNVVAKNKQDMALHAFWLANMSHLLYCIRRDSGLVVATTKHQLALSELISDVYQLLVRDAERRLFRVLDAAILEHEPIPGLFGDVKYETDWRRLFGIGLRTSNSDITTSPSVTGGRAAAAAEGSEIPSSLNQSVRASFGAAVADGLFQRRIPDARMRAVSPRIVTTLLSSTLFVLQTYKVHPTLIQHSLSQLFYYLSVVLFNRILSTHSIRCRSKAVQIRMNVSTLEDWVRYNALPTSLLHHLDPLIELLQLLQCLTQLSDLPMFLETRAKLRMLTPLQIRRVVDGYRYEVGEERIAEEVHQYVVQVAEDTSRMRQVVAKEREREKIKRTSYEKGEERNDGAYGKAKRDSNTVERDDGATDEVICEKKGNATKPEDVEGAVKDVAEKQEFGFDKVDWESPPTVADDNNLANVQTFVEAAKPFRPTPPLTISAESDQPIVPNDKYPLSPDSPILTDECLVTPSPVEELKDADYMLPFSVPTNHAMTLGWGRQRISAWYGGRPVIPEGFVEMLDKKRRQ